MFPTSLEHPYAPRGRRRGRNDPNSRDYICPCGKSYLSYPALFTHIKIKHNGRAPGQIIKPKTQSLSKRGRPRQKQVYDSQSDTNDIAANCIDRLCDFVTDFQKPSQNQARLIKQLYMKDHFYNLYVNFNPQQQQPQYNQRDDLYQQYCDNVFCQVVAQVNKRINQPYHVDLIIVYFMKLAHYINSTCTLQNNGVQRNQQDYGYGQEYNEQEHGQNEQEYIDQEKLDQEEILEQDQEEILHQDQEEIHQQGQNNQQKQKGQKQQIYDQKRQTVRQNQQTQQKQQGQKQKQKVSQFINQIQQQQQDPFLKLKQQYVRNIINYVNNFIIDYQNKCQTQNQLKQFKFFEIQNIKLFTQLFFQWLTIKKYIGYKVKLNKSWK